MSAWNEPRGPAPTAADLARIAAARGHRHGDDVWLYFTLVVGCLLLLVYLR